MERVIVGRSEVLTPEFEEALTNGNISEFNSQWGSDRFYWAYRESRNSEPIREWTTVTSDGFVGISHSDKSIPYVAIPNPFQEELSIYGNVEGSNEIVISVYSTIGERVFFSVIQSYNGAFSNQLKLNNLAPGLYFIKVSDGLNSWTRKIVKGR